MTQRQKPVDDGYDGLILRAETDRQPDRPTDGRTHEVERFELLTDVTTSMTGVAASQLLPVRPSRRAASSSCLTKLDVVDNRRLTGRGPAGGPADGMQRPQLYI